MKDTRRMLGVAFLFCATVLASGCAGQKSDQASMDDQAMMEPPAAAPSDPAMAEPPAQPQRPAPAPARPRAATIPEESHAPVQPPRPAEPETVTVTIPTGTNLPLVFDQPLTSETAQPGDKITARLTTAIVVGDRVAFPADSRVEGSVSDVKPAKKGYKDTGGAISVTFNRLVAPGGRSATITAGFTKIAEGSAGKKAAIIGGSAVGGALLGKAMDKDTEGAALIGGAIGAAVAGATKGREAVIKPGEEISVALEKSARTTLAR